MPKDKSSKAKKFMVRDHNLMRLLIFFVIVFAVFSFLRPKIFLQGQNILNMAGQLPILGLLAMGVALALITGGIDLSGVNIANLSGILSGMFMVHMMEANPGFPPALLILIAVIISLAVGFILGAFNGFLISVIGIPPILATLGTSQLYMGIAIVMTNGKAVSGWPSAFDGFFNASVFGVIPVSLIIFIVVALLLALLLNKMRYGRRLYLLGTNMVASKYAGIKIHNMLIRTYAIAGVLAAIAGLLVMASANSAKADYGITYTMQAILVAVLGGVSPNGGTGKVSGIVTSVVILQVLSSGLNLFEQVSNFYRDLIWGLVLILVLIFNYYVDRASLKRQASK